MAGRLYLPGAPDHHPGQHLVANPQPGRQLGLASGHGMRHEHGVGQRSDEGVAKKGGFARRLGNFRTCD